MGVYVSERTLLQLGRQHGSVGLTKSASARVEDVFLSHSSEDRALVAGAIRWLADQGITVYIDKMDPAMPKVTSAGTADRLRTKISQCKTFLLLATNNAIKSRWVPWELGLADGMKGADSVIILPVEDSNGRWDGNEYIRRYARVASTQRGGWAVFHPNTHAGGQDFKKAMG